MSTLPEQSPSDSVVLSPYEQIVADQLSGYGKRPHTMENVAAGLAGAFLLYRLYMSRRLKEERPAEPTSKSLWELNARLFEGFLPRFAATLAPSLLSGYIAGMAETQAMVISQEQLSVIAGRYARSLGEYVHEVSSEALIEGFQAQVNRRVRTQVAADHVIDAFGVAPRTMKALVNLWTAAPVERTGTSAPAVLTMKDRADNLAANAVRTRAVTIGDTEAYAAKNQAKALVWMSLQDSGDLGADATKMWVTARDEKVCKICGPMDRKRIGLREKFLLPGGQSLWSPSAHANCRCNLVLRAVTLRLVPPLEQEPPQDLDIAKALGNDTYDRDKHGQFASVETRSVRTYAEPERATAAKVESLLERVHAEASMPKTLAEVFARYGVTAEPVRAVSVSAAPTVSATPVISATRVSATTISATPVSADTAPISARTQRVRASSQKVAARAQQAAAATATAQARIVTPTAAVTPPKTVRNTQRWQPTPLNQPMYGFFPPMLAGKDPRQTGLWADDEVQWYTAGERGLGIPSLQQGLVDYYTSVALGPEAITQMFTNELIDAEQEHGNPTYDILQIDRPDRAYFITEGDYWNAWMATVQGLSREESPMLDIEVDMAPSDSEWDEGYCEVSSWDLANWLGLHERMDEVEPIVGRAVHIDHSTGALNHWGGVITQPLSGWTPISQDLGAVRQYLGRDVNEAYPYKLYDIEPTDL